MNIESITAPLMYNVGAVYGTASKKFEQFLIRNDKGEVVLSERGKPFESLLMRCAALFQTKIDQLIQMMDRSTNGSKEDQTAVSFKISRAVKSHITNLGNLGDESSLDDMLQEALNLQTEIGNIPD